DVAGLDLILLIGRLADDNLFDLVTQGAFDEDLPDFGFAQAGGFGCTLVVIRAVLVVLLLLLGWPRRGRRDARRQGRGGRRDRHGWNGGHCGRGGWRWRDERRQRDGWCQRWRGCLRVGFVTKKIVKPFIDVRLIQFDVVFFRILLDDQVIGHIFQHRVAHRQRRG